MSDERGCHAEGATTRRPRVIDAASVQPIVLVGGRSRRFGRDKLVEPILKRADDAVGPSECMLVERPIAVLREVFGARVKLVGDCDARVAACGDGMIADLHPGVGPIGGIVSALEACGGSIFVLAGDMPSCDSATVRAIVTEAVRSAASPRGPTTVSIEAIMALGDRLQPCVALYLPQSLPRLRQRIREGRYSLIDAFPAAHLKSVTCDPRSLRNVNELDDLPGASLA